MNSWNPFASHRTHVFFAISLSLVLEPGAVSAGRLGNAASSMTSATYTARVFVGRGMVVPTSELDFYRVAG
jgi:hypothetical protein